MQNCKSCNIMSRIATLLYPHACTARVHGLAKQSSKLRESKLCPWLSEEALREAVGQNRANTSFCAQLRANTPKNKINKEGEAPLRAVVCVNPDPLHQQVIWNISEADVIIRKRICTK